MSARSIARNGISSFRPAVILKCWRVVIGTAIHSLISVCLYATGYANVFLTDSDFLLPTSCSPASNSWPCCDEKQNTRGKCSPMYQTLAQPVPHKDNVEDSAIRREQTSLCAATFARRRNCFGFGKSTPGTSDDCYRKAKYRDEIDRNSCGIEEY